MLAIVTMAARHSASEISQSTLKRKFPIDDYLRVRMAEAFHALFLEEVDSAIQIIDFVLKAEAEFADRHLVTLAHFWKGRAHRKKGEYEAALQDIVQARQLAQNCDDCRILAAVIQIQESWLLFQRGSTKEALRLLAHAEGVLKSTDHYFALGNIESARGRIVRRSGEYAKALEHFERASSDLLTGRSEPPERCTNIGQCRPCEKAAGPATASED